MTAMRVAVAGAGIVGLAVARELQRRFGVDVHVIEKERAVALHQTGHNSNVVHSGVYYPPDSLKATLCRRGVALLTTYCRERGLPYEQLGKVIVAVRPDELAALHNLHQRAHLNGVRDARLIDAAELRDREPHVRGLQALLIPSTAVVDYPQIARQLAAELDEAGGELLLGEEMVGARQHGGGVVVSTSTRELLVDHVVVCAGLQSSMLARALAASPHPEVIPFRGEYYEMSAHRKGLINGLVYPVPDPRYPFLGVHFTAGIGGGVHVGPNAVLALSAEGYRWRDVRWADMTRIARYPGMRRLALRHWRMGLNEIAASLSKRLFVRRARAYLPELAPPDLIRTEAGVRAQAVALDGTLVDDFVIDQRPGMTLVRNAPSPAATASLAIAEYIVDQISLPA